MTLVEENESLGLHTIEKLRTFSLPCEGTCTCIYMAAYNAELVHCLVIQGHLDD